VAWVEQGDSNWDDPDVRGQTWGRFLISARYLTLVELERETASAGQIVLYFSGDVPAEIPESLSKSVKCLMLQEIPESSLKSLRLVSSVILSK
jgi:hypothetical protein